MNTCSRRIVSWEAHLIERASAGDAEAFELLADQYRPALNHLAHRMLRNADDAKDAVQETLLKAFRAIDAFNSDRPIRPWLCRICANCCVDAVRSRKKEPEAIEQHEYMLHDDAPGLEERAAGSIRQSLILDAVAKLPEKYRSIIFMRHFKHMDVNEIACALNKPEGTIKSWLFRARALLKKDLRMALG